jgi:protein-disulfide isomerase
MPSKRRNRGRRSRNQSAGKKSGLPTYAIIAGIVVVALIAVAALALLDQGAGSSQADSDVVSMEKSYGAEDAPVVVVEYADFQCPYCRQFAEGAGQQLKADYADQGQVRFVFRHFAFIGEESIWAAEAAECANEQDRFWDYHDKLYDEQSGENQGTFSKDNLKRFAADLGLDTGQFNECLDSGRYRSIVQDEIEEAQRRRISSTPSVLVNGQLVQNWSNYQALQAAIEAALPSQ